MLSSESMTHGNAYCGDEQAQEYDSFLGPQRTGVLYDWSIRRWRRVKIQPLRTAADRVAPTDLDAQLGEESQLLVDVEQQQQEFQQAGSAALRRKGQATQWAMRLKIVEHLTLYGPRHIMGLVHDLEIAYTQVEAHVKANRDSIYVPVGRTGKAVLWGLVGVHDKEG